jgi:hypothetical protein
MKIFGLADALEHFNMNCPFAKRPIKSCSPVGYKPSPVTDGRALIQLMLEVI